MLSIHKINPMVRAIGTMGAVAAVAGGITFATLTSNVVALGPTNVSTGSAHLQIATDTAGATTGDNCGTFSDSAVAAFGTVAHMTSSTTVPDVNFCLKNTGDVNMNILGALDTNVSSAVASGYLELHVSCQTIGTNTDNLNHWYAAGETYGTLNAGATDECVASLSLSNTYPGSGGETVPQFNITFQGTQS